MADAAAELERLCEVMHDAYETAAQREGWETQERSRKPWSEVPDANKKTMRHAVLALLFDLNAHGRLRTDVVTPSRTDRQPPASASETKGGETPIEVIDSPTT